MKLKHILILILIGLIASVSFNINAYIEKKIETTEKETKTQTFQEIGDTIGNTGSAIIPYTLKLENGKEVKINIRLISPSAE